MAPCRDLRVRIAAAKSVLSSVADPSTMETESTKQADAVVSLVEKNKAKLDAEERNYLIEAVQGVPFVGNDKLRIVALLAPLVSSRRRLGQVYYPMILNAFTKTEWKQVRPGDDANAVAIRQKITNKALLLGCVLPCEYTKKFLTSF